MSCVLSSALTDGVRNQFLGLTSWFLSRTVREKLRLSGPDDSFLLSSMQLWLLEMAPLGTGSFAGLKRVNLFFGGLSDGKTQGRQVGLLEVRVWGWVGLESKPEDDLLVGEGVFLSLPEMNK